MQKWHTPPWVTQCLQGWNSEELLFPIWQFRFSSEQCAPDDSKAGCSPSPNRLTPQESLARQHSQPRMFALGSQDEKSVPGKLFIGGKLGQEEHRDPPAFLSYGLLGNLTAKRGSFQIGQEKSPCSLWQYDDSHRCLLSRMKSAKRTEVTSWALPLSSYHDSHGFSGLSQQTEFQQVQLLC